ncbi:MAG: homoserine dehydrogenase, partial [Desulfobaccales bacterium]
MKTVKVGVIGFGTVGEGVVRLLLTQQELLARRLGAGLVLAKVADLDLERHRDVAVPRELFTSRAAEILDDPG